MWAHAWVFPFGFFFLLIAFAFTMRMIFGRRFGGWGCGYGYGWRQDCMAHEAVLKRRLAEGQITEEDYQRLRDLLRQ